MGNFEAVIGLETHIQLNTLSKIFCACKADSWEASPNTNICPVCSGLPGVLPVFNAKVAEKAVLLAEAMRAEVQRTSYFDRKNYFYPDLPKGYQISQFDQPLATGGFLDVPIRRMPTQKAGLRAPRAHHKPTLRKTPARPKCRSRRMVDFNRCGVPLVEMVTEPDLRSADEAAQYLIRLRQLLRWIGISEADMEKGNLRCDGNVSIRPMGSTQLFTKTEIKNVNSIDSLRESIRKEIDRQIRVVEEGGRVEAWTLEWDEDAGVLRKMAPRRPSGLPLASVNPTCCRWRSALNGRTESSRTFPSGH